jgi:membrane fusion protein (multidrug efflux system)
MASTPTYGPAPEHSYSTLGVPEHGGAEAGRPAGGPAHRAESTRAIRRAGLACGVVLAALMLAACGAQDGGAAAPDGGAGANGTGGGMPPPEVGVLTVTPQTVALVTELPGRLEPVRIAQVRARAAGVLQKRVFQEGSDVRAGDLLFRIDAAPYRAAFGSAQASLARAEANLALTRSQVERYRPLVKANAISQQDYTNAEAAFKQAQADVAVGRAQVQTAKINLDYANVTAPISGRIGRALVTEGGLVGQGEPTHLATIQQIDSMYVNFTQSTTDLLALRRAMNNGSLGAVSGEGAGVRIVLEDGSDYAAQGKLLFTDLTVDESTGQVTLRAQVPNPNGVLLPGMYVRVKIEQAQVANAVLLPQQAVTRSAQGDTVMVVADDGKVSTRKISIASARDNQWVVQDGLQAGEKVIVDGFQKMMVPGAPVKPVPWRGSENAAAPAASAVR